MNTGTYIVLFAILLGVWTGCSLGGANFLGNNRSDGMSEARLFGMATIISMILNGLVAGGTLLVEFVSGKSVNLLNIFQLTCLIVFVLLAVATGMFALQIRREGASRKKS